MKTLVPRHPWTLGDNAPTKRLDSGRALIHVQRDHRETVPILEPQVRRSCPTKLSWTSSRSIRTKELGGDSTLETEERDSIVRSMGNRLTVYASDRLSTKNVQADAAATAAAAPVLLLFV